MRSFEGLIEVVIIKGQYLGVLQANRGFESHRLFYQAFKAYNFCFTHAVSGNGYRSSKTEINLSLSSQLVIFGCWIMSKSNSHVGSKLRKQVKESQGHQCAMCQIKEDGFLTLQIHHVVPICKGGTNEVDNLIALCPNDHCRIHSIMDQH